MATETDEKKPAPAAAPSILEKFNQIEINFNKHYLVALNQITGIVEGDEGDKEKRQYELLAEAYERWYNNIKDDPRCMESCVRMYKAIGDGHELLMKRDQQLFKLNGQDLFAAMFDQPGIDTAFLFDQLRDGLDDVDPDVPEEERDAKENLWSMLIGLYRLCAMICIYLKMPLVREIIDMILLDNPGLNQQNMFTTIFQEFKGKRRLRKLIMKLLKSKEDNFGEIFSSLQKVIATFGSEVNLDTNMKANLDKAKAQIRSVFEQLLAKAEVTTLTPDQVGALLTALSDKDEGAQNKFVTDGVLTQAQLDRIVALFKEQKLDQLNVNKVVGDLGRTMTDMMAAIESNDEDAMQKILSRDASGLNLGSDELTQMQSEMERFEKEAEDDDDDADDSKNDANKLD